MSIMCENVPSFLPSTIFVRGRQRAVLPTQRRHVLPAVQPVWLRNTTIEVADSASVAGKLPQSIFRNTGAVRFFSPHKLDSHRSTLRGAKKIAPTLVLFVASRLFVRE
jgi:hypothetical protein